MFVYLLQLHKYYFFKIIIITVTKCYEPENKCMGVKLYLTKRFKTFFN